MAESEHPIETLVEGLTREWRCGNRLVIYRLHSFNLTVLDTYLESCRLMVEESQPHRPEYGLHHYASAHVTVDARLYNRLMKLADVLKRQQHRAVAGIIFPDTWVFRSLTTLADIFARRSGDVTLCYFVDFDTAQRWIEGVMERDGLNPGDK
jgi:hypothetical protein